MEAVRTSANPLGLQFLTQYGGSGGTNKAAQNVIGAGVGLVNYRGHGDFQEYWNWDSQGSPFDMAQVGLLNNVGDALTVFFNIACYTGGFQTYKKSMAEELMLLPPRSGSALHRGAVSVLGATEPSYTEQNNRFDVHLFNFIQTNEDISVGTLNMLANNKLALENNGQVVDNTKMYILFSDPLVKPLVK